MSRLYATRRIGFIFFITAGLSTGCGGGDAKSVALVPVSGKVTVDGKAVTSGQVSFMALDDKAGAGLCVGVIGANGEYKMASDGKPGAPIGKYKATVTASMVPPTGGGAPTASYNPKYSNAQSSPLGVDVVSNPAAGAYDLKLTK